MTLPLLEVRITLPLRPLAKRRGPGLFPNENHVVLRCSGVKRILLIEDNEDNRELVCAILEEVFEIESCADAHQALNLLEDLKKPLPDVLLVDISLPGIDGVQFLLRVRSGARLASIPAIALTAHAMKDDEARFISSGFDGYFSKPIVDDALLIRTINHVIDSRAKN